MRAYRPVSLNVLWFLIALNVIIFAATVIVGPYPIPYADPFANPIIRIFGLSTITFFHQPWTIITNMFVHGGFGHLLGNMISLFFLGRFLLQLVGEQKFLLVYFLGGILGNVLFLLLAPHYAIGIGASGAIFALGGTLIMLAPGLKVFIIPIPIPVPLWVAIIIFLFISLLPGIAWQAHLGGLLLGLGAGYYFRKKRTYFYR